MAAHACVQENRKGRWNQPKDWKPLVHLHFSQLMPSQSEGHILMGFLKSILLHYISLTYHASRIELLQPPLGICHYKQKHCKGQGMTPTC